MTEKETLKPSGKNRPCPICNRTKDGDCRIGENIVLCHHGNTNSPPDLAIGQTIVGIDQQDWAYVGESADGRTAKFTIHKALPTRAIPASSANRPKNKKSDSKPGAIGPAIQLAVIQRAHPAPPDRWPDNYRLHYSANQFVLACRKEDGKKEFYAFHVNPKGNKEIPGRGPDPWPVYGREDAVNFGRGKYLVEAEGEKCAEMFKAAGLVAISQPGHDHKCESIRGRYEDLKLNGVCGIIYVSDNDQMGIDRARECEEAAACVGLEFHHLSAFQIWGILPSGGSIDDAKGTLSERVSAFKAEVIKLTSKPKRRDARPRKLSQDKKMRCFDKCVAVQAARQRNSLKRRARLRKVLVDLELNKFVTSQEISEKVLEEKDRLNGHCYKSLGAEERLKMKQPIVRWVVVDVVPMGDLAIVGGRPKVGKTRLTFSLVASVLNGVDFLGFNVPENEHEIILVTDDQSDADTASMLRELGVWGHPRLTWSPSFRMNEADIDQLIEDVKSRPGAIVVLDSLRSISRSLKCGENDPEIGAFIYDLKSIVVEAGGTLIIIHHCNKTQDLVGVEALSGHSSIAGAANTVITLHYCPNNKGQPDKDNKQRRLVREARSGSGYDVVISPQPGSGHFYKTSSFSAWQQQIEEASRRHKQETQMTNDQKRVYEFVENQGSGVWLTCRNVVEGLGYQWLTGNEASSVRVRNALKKLVELGSLSDARAGTGYTYCLRSDNDEPDSLCSEKTSNTSNTSEAFDGMEFKQQDTISKVSKASKAAKPIAPVQPSIEPVEMAASASDGPRHKGVELVEVFEASSHGGHERRDCLFEEGDLVDIMFQGDGWDSGWKVELALSTGIGTRIRVQKEHDYKVVGCDEIRPTWI